MNEFTKEELKEIGRSLVAYYCDPIHEVNRELIIKIAYMTENYCDHEEREYYADVAVGECKKCHIVIL